MKLKLKKVTGSFGMQVENEEGQFINFDANESIGGSGFGVRPMEAVASSLAACASIDVLLILEKQRVQLSDYQVDITANRIDALPAIFSDIHLDFKFTGSVDLSKLERAVNLSMTKYCSVSKILEPTCRVTFAIKHIKVN